MKLHYYNKKLFIFVFLVFSEHVHNKRNMHKNKNCAYAFLKNFLNNQTKNKIIFNKRDKAVFIFKHFNLCDLLIYYIILLLLLFFFYSKLVPLIISYIRLFFIFSEFLFKLINLLPAKRKIELMI